MGEQDSLIRIEELSPPELLLLHGRIAEELRRRGITRTSNNPTGDLAEFLFCKAFGWRQHHNSKATSTPSTTRASATKSKAAA